jgi:REP element-mobilizing transposase RayT
VKYRQALISKAWKDDLHKYITGIVQQNDHKLLAINSMPDHIHILMGFRPTQTLSDLMQDVKSCSSKWINDKSLCRGRFQWQEGYGGFAVQKQGIYKVIDYILDQEAHHARVNFRNEYLKFLKDEEVEFNEKYIFTEPQDYPGSVKSIVT